MSTTTRIDIKGTVVVLSERPLTVREIGRIRKRLLRKLRRVDRAAWMEMKKA